MCRLNHVIRSRHCVHRHLRTRRSRHHHWQRVYHFCFQDSIWTPSETDLPSSDQLGCRWSTRRSRRSCRSGDPQNSGNWYQIAECLVGPSSLWFVCFTDVSRSYFARTRLCRVLAATSSSHKHSSLLFKHRYRLGNWVMHHRTVFINSVSRRCGYSLCRGCYWFGPSYFTRHYLCKLLIYSFATVRYTSWRTRRPKKINARPEYTTFKDILLSSRCVAYLLVAWFPRVHH